MTWHIQNGSEIIVLDSDSIYSGSANPSPEEKLVRKAVGLPITKQLIYYNDKHDPSSIVYVLSYRIIEMYQITERWFIIEIYTEDGKTVRVHSVFLAEMQKPSFIADMKAQEEKID